MGFGIPCPPNLKAFLAEPLQCSWYSVVKGKDEAVIFKNTIKGATELHNHRHQQEQFGEGRQKRKMQ